MRLRACASLLAAGAFVCGAVAEELHDYKLTFIKKAPGPIVIDGRLDDAAWAKATVITDFGGTYYSYGADQYLPPTEARLLWDDKYLYLSCKCYEDTPENMAKFRVDISDESGLVCNHDTFEFHLNGAKPGELPKYQLFLVPMAAKEIQVTDDLGWGREVDIDYGRKADWEKAHFIGKDFWSVEAKIAFESLGVKPRVGFRLGFNMARLRFNKSFYTATTHEPTQVRHVQDFCWANRKETQHSTRHGRGILVVDEPANVVEGLKLSYPDLDSRTVLVQTEKAYVVVENGKTSELGYLDKARALAEETLKAYAKLDALTNAVPEPKKGLYARCFAQATKDRADLLARRADYLKATACDVGELATFEENAAKWTREIDNAYYAALRQLMLAEGKVRYPVKLVADPNAPKLADQFTGLWPLPWKRANDGVRWMRPAACGTKRIFVGVEIGDVYAAWELMHRLDLQADVYVMNDTFHLRRGKMCAWQEYWHTEQQKLAMLETTLAENRYDGYVFIGNALSLLPLRIQCALAERLLDGARILSVNGDEWGYALKPDASLLPGIPAMTHRKAVSKYSLETTEEPCEFPALHTTAVGKGAYSFWAPKKGTTYIMYTALLPGWCFEPKDMICDEYCYAAASRVVAEALGMRGAAGVRSVKAASVSRGERIRVTATLTAAKPARVKAALVVRGDDGRAVGRPAVVETEVRSGETPVAFEQASLPVGRYFADVFLIEGRADYDGKGFVSAKTLDWASGVFRVSDAAGIACIAPKRLPFAKAEPVAATVTVTNAPAGARLVASLRDPKGRVIERGEYAAAGTVEVSFPCDRLVENCHFIVCSLVAADGTELARAEKDVYRKIGRRDDYTLFGDGFDQGGINGWKRQAIMEYYGVGNWQNGAPTRLMFGGDPVARDRIAGASSENDGSMSSPYFLERITERFRRDAARIGEKNGLFISCGDDSGVPNKFSATSPDWAAAYCDIVVERLRAQVAPVRGRREYDLAEAWAKERGIPFRGSWFHSLVSRIRPRDRLPDLLKARLSAADFDDIVAAIRKTYTQPNGIEHFNRQNNVAIRDWSELTPDLIRSIRPAPSSEFLEFQFWLRDVRYRGDLAALRAFWQSDVKDFFAFDEETIVTLKSQKKYGAELDRRKFFEHLLVTQCKAIRAGVDAVDPSIQTFMGCTGYYNLMEPGMMTLGSTCPYWMKQRETEMFRCLKARGGLVGDTLGTYNSGRLSREQRDWDVWHSVLTGANMGWFWTPNYAIRGELGVENGYARYTCDAYREVKRGPASLMLRSTRANDGIRILWSTRSAQLEGLRSENGSCWEQAKTFQTVLEGAGYQYDYCFDGDIDAGKLLSEQVRVLVLPAARRLAPQTAEAIRAFVRAGGVAIADHQPADVAENGELLEKPLLADVFADGDAALAARTFGKGRTVVLNFNPVNFKFANGTPKDAEMTAQLEAAIGFPPVARIRWADGRRVLTSELTRFVRGDATYVGFEKKPGPGETYPGKAAIVFPEKAWTYDLRKNRALGFVDTIPLTLKGFDTEFYSRLAYEVKAVKVDAPTQIRRGETLKVRARLVTSAPVKGTPVLRVDLVPPGGYTPERFAPIPYRLVDAPNGEMTCEIAIAWNEPVGQVYTLQVTDVGSGVAFEQRLAVVDEAENRESLVFVGAHPDDFEGCLGLAILASSRYDIHIATFTGGERGIKGKSPVETRAIRGKEDEAVAAALGAKLHRIGQVDGEAFATPEATGRLVKLLDELRPRAVFVHFPIDVHGDHVMTYAATFRAWLEVRPRSELYFFEEGGIGQTHNFHPQHYVDITSVWNEKTRLMRLWESQNADDFLVRFKEPESLLRGAQMVPPVKYAEAYESVSGLPAGGPTLFQSLDALRGLGSTRL